MSEATDGSTGIKEVERVRRATDLPADAPWWMRWLDANIHEAWRWGSMVWPAICATAVETWATLPADKQQQVIDFLMGLIPPAARPHVLAGVFVFAMILRVVNLSNVKVKQGDTQ